MPRVCAVGIVASLLVIVPARQADAQGFWRWFEKLSGPELSGLAVEFVFACVGELAPGESPSSTGGEIGGLHADLDPNCARFDRKTPIWFDFGVHAYLLSGDDGVTPGPDAPVTAWGVMPVIDISPGVRLPGVTLGAAPVWRWYSTTGDEFTETTFEAWVKWRPVRTFRRGDASSGYNFTDDGFLVRLAAIRHGGFDAGRFGPGTAALESEWSIVLSLTADLGAWRR